MGLTGSVADGNMREAAGGGVMVQFLGGKHVNSRRGRGRAAREPSLGVGDSGGCGRVIYLRRNRTGNYVMDIGLLLGGRGNEGRAVNSRGVGAGR